MLVPLAALLLALTGCGGEDPSGTTASGSSTAPAPAGTTAAPEPAPAQSANEGCDAAEEPEPREVEDLKAPKDPLPRGKRHTLVLETSCGTIAIALDTRRAPKTTASIAALARRGFYDGLPFHRIGRDPAGEDFVIQAGDPLGTGEGGPGYSVVEEPPRTLRYTRGVVAMAKTQLEDPGTSGSQFFIVTAKDAGLPAQYALVGAVTGGRDALARIAAVEADPATERPLEPVVIKRALVRSR